MKDGMKEGIKYDKEKLMWDILPVREVEQIVKVLNFGANKYGRFNWQDLEDPKTRYLNALYRHLIAYHKGEQYDEETKLSHLAHLATNALFLLFFENEEKKIKKILDD
jgi:hypothetical protein